MSYDGNRVMANLLTILVQSAYYGCGLNDEGTAGKGTDVTKNVQALVSQNEFTIAALNDNLGGDPAPGRQKALAIRYTLNGDTKLRVCLEGETIQLNLV